VKTPSTLPTPAAGGDLATLDADTMALARAIFEQGTAEATRRAYRGDLDYFRAWQREATGRETWPVPVADLVRFITDHLGGMAEDVEAGLVAAGVKRPGPHKLSTIRRRVASVSAAHEATGDDEAANPARSPAVRQLLSKARKALAAKGEGPRKVAAATKDLLDAMLDTCRGGSLLDLRDRALLLVGAASGGRRRSELAALRVEDLTPVPGGYTFTLGRTKTDQAGEDSRAYPVLGRAAAALDAWLEAAEVTEGPAFRGVDRHGNVSLRPLCGRTVARVVKRRAELAGLDPRRFGAHSLRSGFVSQAGRAGVSLGDAMALSGHRSERIALGYHQAGAVTRNPAAAVFG
jgi:integrase